MKTPITIAKSHGVTAYGFAVYELKLEPGHFTAYRSLGVPGSPLPILFTRAQIEELGASIVDFLAAEQ